MPQRQSSTTQPQARACKVAGCPNPVPSPTGKGGRPAIYCGEGDHTAQKQAEKNRQRKLKESTAAVDRLNSALQSYADAATPEEGVGSAVRAFANLLSQSAEAAQKQAVLLTTFTAHLADWEDGDNVEHRIATAQMKERDARNAERIYRSVVHDERRKREQAEQERDDAEMARDQAHKAQQQAEQERDAARVREEESMHTAQSASDGKELALQQMRAAQQERDAALADRNAAESAQLTAEVGLATQIAEREKIEVKYAAALEALGKLRAQLETPADE